MIDMGQGCPCTYSALVLMPGGLGSQERGVSLSGGDGEQADPRGPWPLKEVLVQNPAGSPVGTGGRKLTIDALQISSLQKCLCFPTYDPTRALCSRSLLP